MSNHESLHYHHLRGPFETWAAQGKVVISRKSNRDEAFRVDYDKNAEVWYAEHKDQRTIRPRDRAHMFEAPMRDTVIAWVENHLTAQN